MKFNKNRSSSTSSNDSNYSKQKNSHQIQPNKRLFIGGIPSNVNQQAIKDMFSTFGTLTDFLFKVKQEGHVLCFVQYSTIKESQIAKNKLDGQRISGRSIKVSFAYPKNSKKPQSKYQVQKPNNNYQPKFDNNYQRNERSNSSGRNNSNNFNPYKLKNDYRKEERRSNHSRSNQHQKNGKYVKRPQYPNNQSSKKQKKYDNKIVEVKQEVIRGPYKSMFDY